MRIPLSAVALSLFTAGCSTSGGSSPYACNAGDAGLCEAQTQAYDARSRKGPGHSNSYHDRVRRQGRQQCDYVVGHGAWICY